MKRKHNNDSRPKSKTVSVLSDEYKRAVRSQSTLGARGWTVPKSALTLADMTAVRHELRIKKEIAPGCPVLPAANDAFVPAYCESEKKLYIPRYWAQMRYGGLPDNDKLPARESTAIAIQFHGALRPAQMQIVQQYMNHVEGVVAGGGLLSVPCAAGKTVMAINIICSLQTRTLIVVHKEFLLNQWIERIGEFARRKCGGAVSIGRIQGDVFDVEGRDIVIGMLQTLYLRDFADGAFASFGMVVVDETHRIASEQFSRALFKLGGTRYTLGITATLQRKDGLDCILQMFLGPIVYHEDRKNGEDKVTVRAIEFQAASTEQEYNATMYDARGNVMYSSMIVKLCNYDPRKQFLVRVLRDLRAEDGTKQIMVLSFTKCLLQFLHDACIAENIGSVGYYVGGMKNTALRETEEKDIVFATYAMAAEALDIKSLSTLVMVTPKTDIVQSVGRILRVKHTNPVVVDIVDSHTVFQKQWATRRRFYRNCGYRIRYVVSGKYNGMSIDWEKDTVWKRVFEPAGRKRAVKEEEDEDGQQSAAKKTCMIDI